jgi:hypothetical protein
MYNPCNVHISDTLLRSLSDASDVTHEEIKRTLNKIPPGECPIKARKEEEKKCLNALN